MVTVPSKLTPLRVTVLEDVLAPTRPPPERPATAPFVTWTFRMVSRPEVCSPTIVPWRVGPDDVTAPLRLKPSTVRFLMLAPWLVLLNRP